MFNLKMSKDIGVLFDNELHRHINEKTNKVNTIYRMLKRIFKY